MPQEITLADGSRLAVPGIVPKLPGAPGGHRRNAPGLGEDNGAVLGELVVMRCKGREGKR